MPIDLTKLPEELKRSARWVLWRLEDAGERKRCKVPKQVTGANASPTDPESWTKLEVAIGKVVTPHPAYKDEPGNTGLGLVIGSPYFAVDLDKCFDPSTGTVDEWAKEMIAKLPGTYTELSPSRRGFHLWYRCDEWAKLPDGIRTEKAEVYSRKRYLTVTGEHVSSSLSVVTSLPLPTAKMIFNLIEGKRPDRTESVQTTSSQIQELMMKADFPDLSAAVQSLLTKLAIHHANDLKVVEAEFKKSALYQTTHWGTGKWERLREQELQKAMEHAKDHIQRRNAKRPDLSTLKRQAKVVKLKEVEPKELTWLWPDRVPAGNVTIFAGPPGIGKSLLTLDLLGRGSLGAPYLDGKPSLGAFKTLLLALEDDRETIIVPRLMALGANLDMVHAIDMVEYLDDLNEVQDTRVISLESDLDQVRAEILSDNRYKLVIIDPISNYLGSKSMFNDQELRQVLMPVVNLAQETQVAVVVVMHNSKQTGRSGLEKIGAAVGGVGVARMGWGFIRTDENEYQVLILKRNLGSYPGFKFGTKTVEVEVAGKVTKQAAMEYLGESTASLENLMAWSEDPEERKNKQVVTLIRKMLPKGIETHCGPIFEEAVRQGISGNAITQARKELGIMTRQKKDGWYWRWADDSEQAPRDAPEGLF